MTVEEAEDFLWQREEGDVRMGDMNDGHLLNVIRLLRSQHQMGHDDRPGSLKAAVLVAKSRGLEVERDPFIVNPHTLAMIVQDIAIALHEEGITETSSAAQRVWGRYSKAIKHRKDEDK